MSQATGEMVYEYKVVGGPKHAQQPEYDDVTLVLILSDTYSSTNGTVCTLKSLKVEGAAE
jgi:hypothetical protein